MLEQPTPAREANAFEIEASMFLSRVVSARLILRSRKCSELNILFSVEMIESRTTYEEKTIAIATVWIGPVSDNHSLPVNGAGRHLAPIKQSAADARYFRS